MFSKFSLKILVIVLIVFSLVGDSFAQTRIRFARGKSSATLSGTIAAGAVREYMIDVREGQTMTVRATSGNKQLDFEIVGRSGHEAWGENGYAQIEINQSGDHYITVKNSGSSATRFTLTVAVK